MKKLLQAVLTGLSCLLFLAGTAQDSTRYKYLLGTNFDFIDGLETKKLYHHLNITIPDALRNKWGFTTGVYQTRQVSKTDTLNFLNRGNNTRQQVSYPDSDPARVRIVLTDSAFLQKSTSNKALGAYFQPTFRLVDSGQTKLYILGHLEYTHRNIEQKNIFSAIPRDTLSVLKSDLSRYPVLPSSQTIKQSQDEGYFGIGLMLFHKNKFVELQVKGIIGMATLDKWRPFYAIDASLMVLKGNFELGLSYKGLLPNYPPYFLNLHLTKIFYLDKIGELLQ